MVYVTLKLVNGTGKALGFCWKGKESHRLKNEERKEERKRRKEKKICVRNNWALVLCFFEHEGKDSATNLSRRQLSR